MLSGAERSHKGKWESEFMVKTDNILVTGGKVEFSPVFLFIKWMQCVFFVLVFLLENQPM